MDKILQSNTEEWKEARLGRFTASCASFLIKQPNTKAEREAGELAKTTKSYIVQQVAEEDTGFSTHFSTPSTDWGKMQEAKCLAYLEEVYKVKIEPAAFVPYGDHAGATPDGFILDGQVQIKNPDAPENHYKYLLIRNQAALKKMYPDAYWQIQYELMCTGRPWSLFASFCEYANERLKLKTLLIKPDPNDIALLKDRLEKAIEYKELLRFEYALNRPAKLPQGPPHIGEDKPRPGSVWND